MKDELPSGISDDLFRLNASTQTSFNKNKLSSAPTSVYLFRLTTPIPIPKVNTTFNGEVYRIPTHYVSFGNPQQKTDIGGVKFNIRSRFLKDQITLNLGMDNYADNLDNERKQYNSKGGETDLTKDTNIATYGVTFRPRVLPQFAPNMGIGFRTYHSKNDLDLKVAANDTSSLIDTSTNTMMVNFGGTLPIGLQKHEATLSFTNMSISDDRPLPDYRRNESENFTVIFNVNSALNFYSAQFQHFYRNNEQQNVQTERYRPESYRYRHFYVLSVRYL